MTYVVYTGPNPYTTNNGTFQTLNAGDSLYISPTGSVTATGTADIAFQFASNDIATIAGAIYASGNAIASPQSEDITITQTGQVLASGEAIVANAVSGETNPYTLTNAGLISSDTSYAIETNLVGSQTINNNGTIVGQVGFFTQTRSALVLHNSGVIETSANVDTTLPHDAVHIIGYDLAPISIYNSGEIFADPAHGYAINILSDDSPDTIVNTGSIIGNVHLGGGDDSFDSSSGATAGIVYGGAGNDTLHLGAGNDVLDGGPGADLLDGGGGINTAAYYDAGAAVTANLADSSQNLGDAAGDIYVSIQNLIGSAYADTLVGDANNNTLNGGAGADTMTGGAGNDTYYVDNPGDVVIEAQNGGTDLVHASVSYTLPANVERLILDGTANINGTGNDLGDVLTGNSGANVLTGGAGNDIIDGGAGADTMIGGAGNDIYHVDNSGDVVIEAANGGTDTVYLYTQGYQLPDNVENLVFATTSYAAGYGNALNNVITGSAGGHYIDGGAGADTMAGGSGNDTYFVDNTGDVVIEYANGGTDLVHSTISYTLGANVENLTLDGSASINGTGNTLANIITGNSGNNVLNGMAGADTMIGGTGNDTYFVDNAGDVVTENANEGTDLVHATINYQLTANVERLVLDGSASINGYGNNLANAITGNAGNNTLGGEGGGDTLTGNAGADSFYIDSQSAGWHTTITDFTVGTDLIELNSAYNAAFPALGGTSGPLNPAYFVAGTAATTPDQHIIYDSNTGNIYYDADGSGSGAQVEIAHVTPGLALTAASFEVDFGLFPL